ncbi:MAG: recombinase family protein [Oscillospiraceae bacterium]|jgi:hypothetical protein|nr:recombinase family protein [Oscillospiraceae bacterium]
MKNIRFIAINDDVDSNKGYNEMMPLKNLFNEWYSRDISKKIKCSQKIISKQGFSIGQPPYGYKRSFENPRIWVIEKKSAETVKMIYKMRLKGKSINKIAVFLSTNKILIPTQHYLVQGIRRPIKLARDKFFWSQSTITAILKNQSYTGDVVNFKTCQKSFKLKKRFENPKDNWEVYKEIHEPIIERSIWEDVQKNNWNKAKKTEKHRKKYVFEFLKMF